MPWRPLSAVRGADVGAPRLPDRGSSPISAQPTLQVQIFGRRDSRETQKALRFFRERRIPVAFVDLGVKPIARGELRKFADRLTPRALLDEQSRAYGDAGLSYMRLRDDELLERLLANQALLKLPLVRAAGKFSVGGDDKSWSLWLNR